MIQRCRACGAPGVAVMTFDYDDRKMWVDDLDAPASGHEIVLCGRHADGRTPPVGWSLTDRRRPVRHLFVAVDVA